MLKRLDSTLLTYGAVIAAYTLITCIVTYPVALTMTTALSPLPFQEGGGCSLSHR